MKKRIQHTFDALCEKCGGVCKNYPASSHTPTPWGWESLENRVRIEGNGYCVAIMQKGMDRQTTEANAAFIVRAVNSHEELLDVMRFIIEMNEKTGAERNMPVAIRLAKKAIAKAEGK